ncbi:MAG: cation transporter [Labilithrix sp.]|nr:cation transporter [Labilithrix sp.]MBX3215207.1 cation transporter [Labilithrix sp.]
MPHDHGHTHAHGPVNHDRAFFVSVALNLGFVVAEVIFGIVSGSMALIADAGHNLGDVLGLVLAWGATWLARKKPSKRRTYGFRRITILAALANAVLLLVATGAIAWESIRRLGSPSAVESKTVIVVAAIGAAINGLSALGFRKGGKHDLNLHGAFLHLVADAAISLAVVVTGVVLLFTSWNLLDPIVSLAVSVVIVGGSWGLLRKSVNLALDAVPEGIDVDAVRAFLEGLPDVVEVHDLHIWAVSTSETALTAHLVMPGDSCHPRFLGDVCKTLHDELGIAHSTLQVEEPGAPDPCRLAADGSL